jgi:DNA-directed RNA polymerase subunit M/transcription elongation factor TFIIS
MIIRKEDFQNGGEVDFTAHYKEYGKGMGRMSLRKRNGNYEVYVHWFKKNIDEVICTSSSLKACIEFTNDILETNDEVEGTKLSEKSIQVERIKKERCPFCNSKKIRSIEPQTIGGWGEEILQTFECSDCKSNWQDIWRLVDINEMEAD